MEEEQNSIPSLPNTDDLNNKNEIIKEKDYLMVL